MTHGPLQISTRRRRRGFTLLETSTALFVMIVLGIALVTMIQQHTVFLKFFRQQTFLTTEAPTIGNLLGRILNEADHYFVYSSKDEALAGGVPVLSNGSAVRLFFKTPTQETEERLIVVETVGAGKALKFYGWQLDGTATSWTISNKISNASFLSNQGILNITLHGPNGEEITYGGGAR
jgi:hypothetical protein